MKTGRSLEAVLSEVERQLESKKDYIADTRALYLRVEPGNRLVLDGVNGGMPLRPMAHGQLAEACGLKKDFYDRLMKDNPELLCRNVNAMLRSTKEKTALDLAGYRAFPDSDKDPTKRLVRCLDGTIRAYLSDSYRPLDNYDLANAVMPTLAKLDVKFLSVEITENRFYIKVTTPKIAGEVRRGDILQAGACISNSEIGDGRLVLADLDYRLECLNGMISERVLAKTHLGRSDRGGDVLEMAREWFRDETRLADDKAFFLKVRDTIEGMFSAERLEARLNRYRTAAERQITANVEQVIEVTAKRFQFTEDEKGGLLRHLIKGSDLSQWGLANAVTRLSQDVPDYDRATQLEAIGGRVVYLNKTEWQQLGEKAIPVEATVQEGEPAIVGKT